MEIEQRSFEEHKTRLVAEFSAEKTRIYNEVRHKDEEFDKRCEKLLQEKKDIVELLNREFSDKSRMMEKRNQVRNRHIAQPGGRNQNKTFPWNRKFKGKIIIFQIFRMVYFTFCAFHSRNWFQFVNNMIRILRYGNVNKKQSTNCVR